MSKPVGPGVGRREAMKHLLWGGAGMIWTLAGGVPRPLRLGGTAQAGEMRGFTFGQISDSHIGYKAGTHPSAEDTLADAVGRMAAVRPDFVIHTGDVSHLSRADQFATAADIMQGVKREVYYVPGEHDTIGDQGKLYFQRFGRGRGTGGWYSFDAHGVHFVGLVNVVKLTPSGLGYFGPEQLRWLHEDLGQRTASTPIVVFTHMPMWSIYPQWGWGTEDSAAALAALRRFGSVTILNGHIHQVIQKVEGNMTYHTADSTAFPQPAPGVGPGPGPLQVPPDQLKTLLGIRRLDVMADRVSFTDMTLAAAASTAPAAATPAVTISNYSFQPGTLTVKKGSTVTWLNSDGDVHTIKSTDGPAAFGSPALDSGNRFEFTFNQPGTYHYTCSVHPYMRGVIVVQ
ncbi:MAG TPA: metallophosphoesterase [Steroidobacteraceae bacterium]|nr:metallophosphoesterase [Steroidobacteraceae bacterium]